MNLTDSAFMPVGVNTAYAKRQYRASLRPLSLGERLSSPTDVSVPNPLIVFRPSGSRPWATPLIIGATVLMSVSGLTMFFDVMPGICQIRP